MDFTDINDAYASQINPLGANSVGMDRQPQQMMAPPPPAVQSNEPVVILPPMKLNPSTTPVYPETVVTDAMKAQQASASHGAYTPQTVPYIDAGSLQPPIADAEPGYFERLGLRKRDVFKLVVLAFMVTLGISVHWISSHYVNEWLESSDFDYKQRLAIRMAYPAAILFVIWNLKAYQ